MNRFILSILTLLSGFTCCALVGDWRGDLTLGNAKLPLVFHFSDNGNKCTLDSPLQGVKGLGTKVNFCNADSVSVSIASIGASYSGKITEQEINGVFSQRGYSFPLVLTLDKSIYDRRPQTPRPPFPYNSVDTTFTSSDNTLLSGTLVTPESMNSKTPVVVFITGSGPQNRDEEMFDHCPFAVMADFLARNGVASFRFDDRGVAKSQGNFKTADINTFKSDAEAAVQFIRSLNLFRKVGVTGHSEGGTIGLMLASDGKVDFAISLAGGIIKVKDILLSQNLHFLDKLQVSRKQKDDVTTLISKFFDDVIGGKAYAEIDIDSYIRENNLDIPSPVLSSFRQNLAAATGSYYRQLLSLTPSEWIGKIKVPVFALNGTLDTQVNCNTNLSELKKLLPNAETKEYPGLNHLFQHAETGEMTEYIEITETVSPEVLEDILKFIKKQK